MDELNRVAGQFPLLSLHLQLLSDNTEHRHWCRGFLDALLMVGVIDSQMMAAASDQIDIAALAMMNVPADSAAAQMRQVGQHE